VIAIESVEEIKRLKARYCRAVDLKQWTELRQIFTDDCEYTSADMSVDGPDDFVRMVQKFLTPMTTFHQVQNPEITAADEGRAIGIWAMQDVLVWPADAEVPSFLRTSDEQTGIVGFGYYKEEYVKLETGWRIARMGLERQLVVAVSQSLPFLAPMQLP
jgi:SnoaL-like domain